MSDLDPLDHRHKRYPPRKSRRHYDAEPDAPSRAHTANSHEWQWDEPSTPVPDVTEPQPEPRYSASFDDIVAGRVTPTTGVPLIEDNHLDEIDPLATRDTNLGYPETPMAPGIPYDIPAAPEAPEEPPISGPGYDAADLGAPSEPYDRSQATVPEEPFGPVEPVVPDAPIYDRPQPTPTPRREPTRPEAARPTRPIPTAGPAPAAPSQTTTDTSMPPSGPRQRTMARRKQRRRRAAAIIVIAALLLVAALGAIHYLGGLQSLFGGADDYEGKGTGQVTVTIPENSTGRDIAKILADKDVVASAQAFENAYRSSSLAKGIQAGTYNMRKHMSASEALALMLNPASKADLMITIPEGFTKSQVKDRLVNVGKFNATDVDKAMTDSSALGLPAEAGGNVEGWLAPDSYTIGPRDTAATLLKRMVDLTIERLDKAGVPAADREKVLIKGSILEREVNKDEYYGKVARVLENRLADNNETHGLLQMDSTVLYGLGKTGGIPSSDELKQDTPYNTYLHKGLPPSPIGAVGEKAITAVMHPEQGSWLYYVTVNLETGETKFATTNAEQNRNTEELKKYCRDNPDVCK
ncbi:MAG: endolytic transglycosylase MltG [Actinomycetaceae bacterium]|nr:endolytic transglycosylase MltG [Actinomycetaceae bacterium]MDU0969476.1 endolytic transglycosylase MltG [Actinomycetaceae bacterium]